MASLTAAAALSLRGCVRGVWSLETRLFGRRAGVRASGRIYGTVGLYISRHIYDLTTSADMLTANRVAE